MLDIIFWSLFAIIILAGAGMQWSEKHITVSKAEYQKNFLVRLQFAKNRNTVKDMIESVSGRGRDALGFNLGIDFAFMIGLYGFLAVLSYRTTHIHPVAFLEKAGCIMSGLMLIPLIGDVIENYCLARWSFKEKWQGPFTIYYWAVRAKWTTAAAVGAFCLGMILVNLIRYQKVFFV